MTSIKVKLLCTITLIWAALVLYLSLSPTPPHIEGPLGWDKLQHACALGFLALLVALASMSFNIPRKKAAFVGLVSASLFGALIEILQGFCTTSRAADINDFFADMAGASIAVTFIFFKGHKGQG